MKNAEHCVNSGQNSRFPAVSVAQREFKRVLQTKGVPDAAPARESR
jgi:hypothetical protein